MRMLKKNLVFFLSLFSPCLLNAEGEVRVNSTNSEIAVSNLNSQIDTLNSLLGDSPGRENFRLSLFDLISTRTIFLGTYTDFDKLKKLSDQLPKSEQGQITKARYYSTVHEFSKALEILEGLDSKNLEVRSLIIRVKLALRLDLEAIKTEQLEILKQYQKHSDFVIMAEIESDLGNFEQADQYFEQALKNYNDTSPFPLAYLFFRRGVMWSEKAENPELGQKYYDEAVHYLPQYVNAQVHRNEIISQNNIQEAISSLVAISGSDDPEPRGFLGELYLANGQESEGRKFLKSASDSYKTFLEKYPLAFLDHASEFYAGPGDDVELSLNLAKRNLDNRKTERSFIVALEAAAKVENKKELCALVDQAKAINPVYISLQKALNEHEILCSGINQ